MDYRYIAEDSIGEFNATIEQQLIYPFQACDPNAENYRPLAKRRWEIFDISGEVKYRVSLVEEVQGGATDDLKLFTVLYINLPKEIDREALYKIHDEYEDQIREAPLLGVISCLGRDDDPSLRIAFNNILEDDLTRVLQLMANTAVFPIPEDLISQLQANIYPRVITAAEQQIYADIDQLLAKKEYDYAVSYAERQLEKVPYNEQYDCDYLHYAAEKLMWIPEAQYAAFNAYAKIPTISSLKDNAVCKNMLLSRAFAADPQASIQTQTYWQQQYLHYSIMLAMYTKYHSDWLNVAKIIAKRANNSEDLYTRLIDLPVVSYSDETILANLIHIIQELVKEVASLQAPKTELLTSYKQNQLAELRSPIDTSKKVQEVAADAELKEHNLAVTANKLKCE